LLESNIYTDQKIADVFERLNRKIDANKEAQNEINMQQAVYNGTNTATIGCLKNEIAQLLALSEMVIPQRKVCDTCCRECNGN
jgi:ribosomal protein L29